jgi:hypothetical protein
MVRAAESGIPVDGTRIPVATQTDTYANTYDGFNHLIRLANGNAWTTLVTQFLACSVSSIHPNNSKVNYLAHGLIVKDGLEL